LADPFRWTVIPVTSTLLAEQSVRAEALFVSLLQPSDVPTATQIAEAIAASLRNHGGVDGCAAAVAAEYGEHPDVAVARMRWALALSALI
jgi:hypothetical protein